MTVRGDLVSAVVTRVAATASHGESSTGPCPCPAPARDAAAPEEAGEGRDRAHPEPGWKGHAFLRAAAAANVIEQQGKGVSGGGMMSRVRRRDRNRMQLPANQTGTSRGAAFDSGRT